MPLRDPLKRSAASFPCGSTKPALRGTGGWGSLDAAAMTRLFISHSSLDDAFVRELRWTLADLKQEVWIDSRELRAGDPL